jgi:putative ABC transport system permease protein
MSYAFSRECREVGREGKWALIVFSIRSSLHVLLFGLGERVGGWRRQRAVGPADAQQERHPPADPVQKTPLASALTQDVKAAFKGVRRAPAFALVSVSTLALGIGASTAMFSTAHNVLLSPLPFAEPERLVMGRATFDGNLNPWAAGADYFDYRDRSDAFRSLGAIMPFSQDHTTTGGEEPERIAGTAVSPNLFATLGVNPQVGRPLSSADGLADAPNVVLISHGYWVRRYGAARDVVGTTLTVDAVPHVIVGVMPAGFRFMPDVELWRPMRPDRDAASDRRFHNWLLVGRLRSGVSLKQAQTQLDVISTQIEASYPETDEGKGILLTDLHEVLAADYRTRLYLLSAAVALVLLIACANVIGILLARAPARRLELSVRAALGASRRRLVLQLLTENMVLAVAAGVLGTFLAVWWQQVALGYMQMDLPGVTGAGISGSILAYAVALSGATGLLVGTYPALSGARANLSEDLKVGSRTMTGGGARFRSGLVVAQVAVSVVLLIGSGLLIRSLVHESAVDPGFSSENTLTAELELPRTSYPGRDVRIQFFTTLLDEVRAIPGVRSVGIINHLPIRSPRNTFPVFAPDDPDRRQTVFLRAVLPGYFETMEVPLLAGRAIEDRDADGTTAVGVINRRAAERFFPDGDLVGERLVYDFFGQGTTVEVVGVVDDVRMRGLSEEPGFALYLPYKQVPFNRMQIAVRTDVAPMTVARALQRAVWQKDGDIPLAGLATMEDLIAGSMSDRRTLTLSLTLYAVLPLLLAAVGLYAVLAYDVSQRSHELGVRMALGADARELGGRVLGRGVGLVALGSIVGLAGAFGMTRLIRQVLFGVEPTDPATFISVTLFVFLVALIACLVPVWRAARVDPMAILQAE